MRCGGRRRRRRHPCLGVGLRLARDGSISTHQRLAGGQNLITVATARLVTGGSGGRTYFGSPEAFQSMEVEVGDPVPRVSRPRAVRL